MLSILEATKLRVPDGIKYPCKGGEETEQVQRPLSEVVPAEDRKYRRHSRTQLLWKLFPLHSSQGATNLLPEPCSVASALSASTSPPVRPGCCPGNRWGLLCFWHRLSCSGSHRHSQWVTSTKYGVHPCGSHYNLAETRFQLFTSGITWRCVWTEICLCKKPHAQDNKEERTNSSLSTQVPHLSITQILQDAVTLADFCSPSCQKDSHTRGSKTKGKWWVSYNSLTFIILLKGWNI